jgi:hypothetical protein
MEVWRFACPELTINKNVIFSGLASANSSAHGEREIEDGRL